MSASDGIVNAFPWNERDSSRASPASSSGIGGSLAGGGRGSGTFMRSLFLLFVCFAMRLWMPCAFVGGLQAFRPCTSAASLRRSMIVCPPKAATSTPALLQRLSTDASRLSAYGSESNS